MIARGPLVFIGCAWVLGCAKDADFKPLTNGPPGAIAELHQDKSNDSQSVRLTEGVAMAIECVDAKERPCSLDGSTMIDPNIATYHRAYTDAHPKAVANRDRAQTSFLARSAFVVVARRPGRTTMTVRTGNGDVPLQIEVLPTSK